MLLLTLAICALCDVWDPYSNEKLRLKLDPRVRQLIEDASARIVFSAPHTPQTILIEYMSHQ